MRKLIILTVVALFATLTASAQKMSLTDMEATTDMMTTTSMTTASNDVMMQYATPDLNTMRPLAAAASGDLDSALRHAKHMRNIGKIATWVGWGGGLALVVIGSCKKISKVETAGIGALYSGNRDGYYYGAAVCGCVGIAGIVLWSIGHTRVKNLKANGAGLAYTF